MPTTRYGVASSVYTPLQETIAAALAALRQRQAEDGHWCFEFEADCTIPAEYILLMHYMDDIDVLLQSKIAVYLRRHQAEHGGWALYHGGQFDMSASVKVYYALKLAGDSPAAGHMRRARAAILAHGGAERANVFTRITLALFRQVPWRAVPFIPVEMLLLPRWFPMHINKVASWSRTVMVPLFILCSLKAQAKNPSGIGIAELFCQPPFEIHDYFACARKGIVARVFLAMDRLGRALEPFLPGALRRLAIRRAEAWFIARLNGVHGVNGIFPAMVNAHEALALLGYADDHPYRQQTRQALQNLLIERGEEAYCQPCVSPIWDTCWALRALLEITPEPENDALAAMRWLLERQITDAPGDWQESRPDLPGGGWAFQYENSYYPDLDDTAAVAWTLHLAGRSEDRQALERAADWLVGMQSRDGGFGAYDVDNTHYYLNEIPFADHKALLDPPTADVSARVLTFLAALNRPQDRPAIQRLVRYLLNQQEKNGSWFGRWGSNYIYGTWSVLISFAELCDTALQPAMDRATAWLSSVQQADGGWGESNDSYLDPGLAGQGQSSTAAHTAWACLALMAAGDRDSDALRRGIQWLQEHQGEDGEWHDPWFNAPGFPRVFYITYHGYKLYFPLWALSRYQNLHPSA
ncbi:squalene--hopene cyclase [Acidithiobacillus sp. IBUN Pt1247-S3]